MVIKRKKKALYIHIGTGKTGTTALQDFFWTNRGKLSDRGIAYPETGVVDRAHHLISPYRPSYLKDWAYLDYKQWIPEYGKAKQSNILISSELFCWANENENTMNEFFNNISAKFNVKVIVYLRRQDNVVWANYNQLIKAGTEKWLIGDVLDDLIKKFDYEQMLEPWKNHFGKENIIVRPYERQQFHNGNIIDDFLFHVFGLEVTNEYELSKENNNPRLSASALEFKRLINNLIYDIEDSGRFNDLLLEYSEQEDNNSAEIFSSKSSLSPSIRNDIMDRFSQSNSNIASEYLGRDDGKLFYDKLPEVQSDWQEEEVSVDKLQEIVRFIIKKDHDLIVYLRDVIKQSGQSKEGNVRLAADILGSLF